MQTIEEVKLAEDWYDGHHPIPQPRPNTLAAIDDEARMAFDQMCRAGIMNWTPPIVDAPAAKCIVNALRFGKSAMSSDPALMQIWQRNQLDADHQLSVVDALKVGSAPILVWDDGDGLAEITIEDPAQVIIAYVGGSRRKRRAALKRWVDDDGFSCATLYLPDWVYKWRSPTSASISVMGETAASLTAGISPTWAVRQPDGEAWPLPNPHGIVPMFELRANPTTKAATYGGGTPEFAPIITDQRRVNEHVFNLLTTEQAQSFRQRWATNWDYPTNPDGSPDREKMLRFAASAMASFSAVEDGSPVNVGEFAQADFRPFIDILALEVKHIASITATPPYAFLIGDMVNVAADALARIEGSFVARIGRHTTQFGETFEEILRAALAIEGDRRADDYSLSVGWIAAEERTAVEQATVARTYFDLGAPQEAVFAMLPDVDRVEAHRWIVQAASERLLTDQIPTDRTVVAPGTGTPPPIAPGSAVPAAATPGPVVTPPAQPGQRNRDRATV
jgi:hypothetical protein